MIGLTRTRWRPHGLTLNPGNGSSHVRRIQHSSRSGSPPEAPPPGIFAKNSQPIFGAEVTRRCSLLRLC